MRTVSKILTGAGIVAGMVAAGLLIGWWGSRGSRPEIPTPVAVQPPLESPPSVHSPLGGTNSPGLSETAALSNSAALTPGVLPPAGTNLLADWEGKVDEVLGSDTEDTNKVKQLFELFPHLPEEGQVEVAQHLSNLVPDENYAALGQLLQNAKLPEAVLDVLMADALNRPNSVKLPTLLDVAQNPDNAKAGEAKDLLELYLDEDYGTDWSKWKDAMNKWLLDNKD